MTTVLDRVPMGSSAIEGYHQSGFIIGGQSYRAVILTPERVIAWDKTEFEQMLEEDFAPVFAPQHHIDVVLLGTGSSHRLLPKPFRQRFEQAGLIIESMDSRAAARTFNVLLGEQRRVGAALLPWV